MEDLQNLCKIYVKSGGGFCRNGPKFSVKTGLGKTQAGGIKK